MTYLGHQSAPCAHRTSRNRLRQGAFRTPSLTDVSEPKRCSRYPKPLGPFGQGQRLAAKRDDCVLPHVSPLLLVGSPSAIRWLVAFVPIKPIQSRARRALAHVHKEVLKTKPPQADGNAASTVVFEGRGARITAPRNHVLPRPICSAADVAMLDPCLVARAHLDGLNVLRGLDEKLPALRAFNVPQRGTMPVSFARVRGDTKAAESQAAHVVPLPLPSAGFAASGATLDLIRGGVESAPARAGKSPYRTLSSMPNVPHGQLEDAVASDGFAGFVDEFWHKRTLPHAHGLSQ